MFFSYSLIKLSALKFYILEQTIYQYPLTFVAPPVGLPVGVFLL